MLRFVALCFAAALASAFSEYSPEPPEYGPVYSVEYDETDLLAGTKFKYQLWFDETKNLSLLEHSGAQALTLVGRKGPTTGWGRLIFGYYVTTETYVNRWTCWNQSDYPLAFDFYFAWQRIMPLKGFYYIGKDVVRGEKADKWQYVVSDDSDIYEFTTWVTEEELSGSQQTVPLRHEVRVFGNYTGRMRVHYLQDFYDFNTSAIDPEKFNIKKDRVDCTLNPKDLEDQISTRFGQRVHLARLTASRSEQDENQGQMAPDIFRHHLRYPDELRSAGRGGPQRARRPAGRADTPPDPSKPSESLPFPYSDAEVEALSEDLPEQFDWRPYGAVTAIQDAGPCGASYALCATGLVSGALYVQKNTSHLLQLSGQAIVDCTWEYNSGCHGFVSIQDTLGWIKKHGLPTEADYGEYLNQNGYCRLANVKTAGTIKGYVEVPENNEKALKLAVLNHGPVSVRMGDFILNPYYNDGVYNDPSCEWGMEYGLVVGWGVLDGQKYWTVKLSRSYRFGIDGYALIAIDKNICGVMDDPVYVVV